jgi:hypothetical protein
MSFILQDKKLINALITQAESLNKKADSSENPDVNQVGLILINNLKKEIGDSTAPKDFAPIGFEPGAQQSADLTPNDMRNLGDLLRKTAKSKITWDGQRISWDIGEEHPDNSYPFDAYIYENNGQISRDADRQPKTEEIYFDKDRLIKYLTHLRDVAATGDAAKTNNKVFSFMICAIIGELNGYLRVLRQEIVKPKVESKVSGIDPNIIIDIVPEPLNIDTWDQLTTQAPFIGYFEKGTNRPNWLQVEDLENDARFTDWLRNKKIQDKKSIYPVLDPKTDPCQFINLLYRRAKFINSIANTTSVKDFDKAAKLYLDRVLSYGKNQLKALDGKPCAVIQPGTSEVPGTAPAGTGAPKGTADYEKVDAQLKMKLELFIKNLPLQQNYVNFDNIEFFLNAANSLGSNIFGGKLETARTSLTACRNFFKNTNTDSLNISSLGWYKDPAFGKWSNPSLFNSLDEQPSTLSQLINTSRSLLLDVGDMMHSFRSKYKNWMLTNSYASTAISSQIGPEGEPSSSILYYNFRDLNNMSLMAAGKK